MTTSPEPEAPRSSGVTFGDDLAFLRAHTEVIVLGDPAGPALAVAPQYQGRVMTSTSKGETGASLGWIHREVIASGKRQPHMNVFGGEDRFWLGPEGGQYGLYFAPGSAFDFEHWQVPDAIDWGAWETTERKPTEARFRKDMVLHNHSGTEFRLRVDRIVRLLSREDVDRHLGMPVPASASIVAYESVNTITNTGASPWTDDKGLLSIWILSMYPPSPETTIVLPFEEGPEDKLGPIVNDAYFGKVAADRLAVKGGVVLFSGDGRKRGKIGIPRPRARPTAGSYDAARGLLTLVQYSLPEGTSGYVNSMWEHQRHPYGGDVVNSYNDGPPAPGEKPLGPFYEIETSSPAAALRPGESATHVHRTLHIEGPRPDLDPIAKRHFGIGLEEVAQALRPLP